jgi:hypothetical protein
VAEEGITETILSPSLGAEGTEGTKGNEVTGGTVGARGAEGTVASGTRFGLPLFLLPDSCTPADRVCKGVTKLLTAVPLTWAAPFILAVCSCVWLDSAAGVDAANIDGTAAVPNSVPPVYGPNGVTQINEGEF